MNQCVVCGHDTFQHLFARTNGSIGQCRACGLVQVVPMPGARQIASLYHEDFDHFAPYIEQIEVHREYFREKIKEIGCTMYDVRCKNLRLLDIGCAMGVLLEEAEKQGIEAYGVDISRDAVAYCRKKGLRVSTDFPKKQFDVVSAFQVIEHERDPLGFMRRVHSVLKKGGLFVLATPDYGGWGRRVMGKRWVGFAHPEHMVFLDFASMRLLLEKAGFADIEIRRDTPRPFPLSFVFTRAADYVPFLSQMLKPLGKLFDRFNIINPINPWNDMIVYAKK